MVGLRPLRPPPHGLFPDSSASVTCTTQPSAATPQHQQQLHQHRQQHQQQLHQQTRTAAEEKGKGRAEDGEGTAGLLGHERVERVLREQQQWAHERRKAKKWEEKEEKERMERKERQERHRRTNDMVMGLLNEIKVLKNTTKQLKTQAEKLRNQVVSMQAEHRSPSSDQDGAAAVETTLSWIPYSNPAHTRSMPPVIGTLFPPMSEASVPFVVDNDDKPLCLIKRQPLSDDRVAIIHAVNASWAKLFLFNPDELLGKSIRRIVEDSSLRDSRNRINRFHAQQATANKKGLSCSPCLNLQPCCIRKDGTLFEALVRQQFFYDSVTKEPLWSILCIDSTRESGRRRLYVSEDTSSPSSSPSPLQFSSQPREEDSSRAQAYHTSPGSHNGSKSSTSTANEPSAVEWSAKK